MELRCHWLLGDRRGRVEHGLDGVLPELHPHEADRLLRDRVLDAGDLGVEGPESERRAPNILVAKEMLVVVSRNN